MLHKQLTLLRHAMSELQQQQIDITTFCSIWRAQTTLLNSLPPKYETVAEDLLVRLETSSLFSEESCSYNQHDLFDNLSVWLDKAEKKLFPDIPKN